MQHVTGPDFPTGGMILGKEGIREAYETGRGRVVVRARAHVEPLRSGKEAIIVTELPFMVKKGGDGNLVEKIAELVRDKKISEISDLRDETDRSGMRLVIELKRDAMPEVVLNKLYKHTNLQTTFGVNTVALVDGVPKTLNLRELVHHYVQHQREVVTRRLQYELRRAERRAHILEGLLIALDNIDAVIALIRGSADPDAARVGLIEQFKLSAEQSQAILDMRLQRLTALESDKIKQEHADLMERIQELRAILGDEDRLFGLIKEELLETREIYGDERRTEHRSGRGRDRPRGPDRRGADGGLDHAVGLHQAAAVVHLSQAAPRRRRRDGDGDQGRGLHPAPADRLDARLPAVLHEPRQGLPAEGVRAAGGRAHGQGPGAS